MIDMALDGDHSFSIITDTLGTAFQTTPQSVRFEEGHTYRISFIYQNALDDTFAFVLGADQSSEPLYQESLKATPAKTGNRTFSYEFTSTSDQTWFAINRVDRSTTVTDNPNPFVIDNILVEDLTEAGTAYKITAESPDGAVMTAPESGIAGDRVTFRVTPETGREVESVSVTAADGAIEVTKISASEYTFTMPESEVTVSAVMKEAEQPEVDKSALDAKIKEAEALKEADYTSETWKALQDALAAAKLVSADPQAEQAEVDAALEVLEAAVKALAPAENPGEGDEKPGEDVKPGGDDDGNKGDGSGTGNNSGDTGNSGKNEVQTGDTASVWGILAIVMVSTFAAAGAVAVRRRRR